MNSITNCNYICKQCGENIDMEDVVKHLVADHNSEWSGNFYDALDEYDRSISFIKNGCPSDE